MLIKLEIENFRSIKSKVTFHTIVRNYKRFTHHIYNYNDKLSILKTSGIYGANGSGKTNLFKGLFFIKMLVENSDYLTTPDGDKLFAPFRLDKVNENLDSNFQIDFIANGNIYIYEISINYSLRLIKKEILTLFNNTTEEIIFKRITTENGKTELKFPKNDEFHQLEDILSGILPNTNTFLSFDVIKNNHLTSVRNWFETKLQFIFPVYEFNEIAYILYKKKEYLNLANEILKYSNTGIDHLKIEAVPIEIYLGTEKKEEIRHITQILQDKDYHPFLDSLNNYCTAIKENNKVIILKLMCVHLDNNNEPIQFDMDQESRGTIVLLHLIPALVLSYGEGVNYFIDDINTSLHPNLLKEIINQYLNHNLGKAKGQLIFNSHEDLIMDENIVRQDEIWLVEKSKNGETDVFPLSDFPNIRFDLNLRKNYLYGKFGAVPFETEPKDLIFSEILKD